MASLPGASPLEQMDSSTLHELARSQGVQTEYESAQGSTVQIADAVLIAILQALGVDPAEADGAAVLPHFGHQFAGTPAQLPVHAPVGAAVEARLLLESGESRTLPVSSLPVEAMPVEAVPNVLAHAVPPPVDAELPGAELPGAAHNRRIVSMPADLPLGEHVLEVRISGSGVPDSHRMPFIVAPARLRTPQDLLPAGEQRMWGLTVQLYSVRSRSSWGIGDFGDLRELMVLAAGQGADFLLINPIHAQAPQPPVENSPYLPSSRQAIDPIYIRIADIPEVAALPAEEREDLSARTREWRVHAESGASIQRDPVLLDKLAALRRLFALTAGSAGRSRGQEFDEFLAQAPAGMRTWAEFNARTGAPDEEIRFWMWTQFIAAEQLRAAQSTAHEHGMRLGLMTDLAVGVSSGGADAWALAEHLASGATVGAPADYYNQQGQDWSQPPWHPHRLAQAGYRPLRDLFRTAFTGAGGIRIDHVMGLFRLWWVPAGSSAKDGAYVTYDAEAILAVLALEAHRAGVVVVGEDLGTVAPGVRDRLRELGVLGTSVMWFEQTPEGPVDPADYRKLSLATLNTHDMHPLAGYLECADISLAQELGLLDDDPQQVHAAESAARTRVLNAISATGIDVSGPPEQVIRGLHEYLAGASAQLVGVSLVDAVGERRAQNIPGTSTQYPNWTVPLCDGQGRPVLVEELAEHPGLRGIAAVMSRGSGPATMGEDRDGRSRRPTTAGRNRPHTDEDEHD